MSKELWVMLFAPIILVLIAIGLALLLSSHVKPIDVKSIGKVYGNISNQFQQGVKEETNAAK